VPVLDPSEAGGTVRVADEQLRWRVHERRHGWTRLRAFADRERDRFGDRVNSSGTAKTVAPVTWTTTAVPPDEPSPDASVTVLLVVSTALITPANAAPWPPLPPLACPSTRMLDACPG